MTAHVRTVILMLSLSVCVFLPTCKQARSSQAAPALSPRLQASLEKAMTLMENGRHAEAKEAFIRLSKVLPANPDVLCGLGDGERYDGHEEASVDYYLKALAIHPKHIGALYGLGDTYVDLERYSEAESLLKIGVETDPSVPGIHFLLGEIEFRRGRFPEALPHFQETLRLCPTYMRANFFMAECYLHMGMFEKARNAYRTEADVNCWARPGLELDLAKLRTIEEPTSAEAFFTLGELLSRKNEIYEAIDTLETCRKLEPAYPGLAAMLGRLYIRSGEKLKARAWLTEALQLNPDDRSTEDELKNLNELMLSRVFLDTDEKTSSWYKGVRFPEEAVVSAKEASVFDYDLNVVRTLPAGASTRVARLYDRVAQIHHGDPDQFYALEDNAGLIAARDVILKSRYDNPAYISASGKLRVIENPIAAWGYCLPDGHDIDGGAELWLLAPPGLASLGYSDLSATTVDFSPDDKYIFRPGGDIYESNGTLYWECAECASNGLLNLLLVSPTWDGNRLYMRSSLDGDDAVYLLSLDTKELSLLIDVPDAEHIAGYEGSTDWPRVRVEGNYLFVTFERWDPNAATEDQRCVEIQVRADKSGHILEKTIHKKRETNNCPSY